MEKTAGLPLRDLTRRRKPNLMNTELPEGLGGRFGNIEDLPEELRAELLAARVGAVEQNVLDLLAAQFDGAATVDEIRVGLFRMTGEIFDRRKLAGKLYRMVHSKPPLLESVQKKKGVYRIP